MRLPRAFTDISATCGFWVSVANLIANATHSPPMTFVFDQHHNPKLPTALGTCTSNLPTTLHPQPFVRFRRAVVPFGRHFQSMLAFIFTAHLVPVETRCSTTMLDFIFLSPAPGTVTLTPAFVLSKRFPTSRPVILCSEPRLPHRVRLGLHRWTSCEAGRRGSYPLGQTFT